MIEDTIAAVSTPPGNGGIGIVRVSGPLSFDIAEKLFRGRRAMGLIKSHTINYGRIVDPGTGNTVDEVLLSKMKSPNTFTREDMVEINCHGGATVLRKVLELVIEAGARPAQAGEFTKRAFLNGRIDLSQAEAVIDLINSKTSEGSRSAVSQLEGKLSERISAYRRKLIELIAHIEVTVDYPEHDIEEITGQQVYGGIKPIREGLYDLAKSFDKGKIIREGIIIVIAGKPNVGKSSLMNSLARSSRAIVTDIPGTTRDIIEEYINVRGIPVRLFDTAGIRETDDPVESIGVEKAQRCMESADLVIMVLDAATGLGQEDRSIMDRLNGKRVLFLINKTDLAAEAEVERLESRLQQAQESSLGDEPEDKLDTNPSGNIKSSGSTSLIDQKGADVIRMSLAKGTGLDELEDRLEGMFLSGGIEPNNEVLVTNVRHKSLIDNAARSLDNAAAAHESGMPLDFVTIDIKEAAESLGKITGESVGEDVIHEIFSRFCVGK